jgi:hypothetical protein
VSLVLFALAGVLLGGAWSMRRQGASTVLVVAMVAFGVLALAGGVAWMLPRGT